jgi:Flp pilus assembly protein TadB
MDGPRLLLAVSALAAASVCLLLLAAPDLPLALRRLRPLVARMLAAKSTTTVLAQAELGWVPAPLWLGLRIGLSLVLGALAWAWFGLVVVGLLCGLVVYHVLGMALEARRRRAEARRQSALLEAIRYGAAVMARSGNAGQMMEALAESGPFQARRIFAEIVDARAGTAALGLAPAIERMRSQLADPVFDDFALSLSLHWRQGGRLVPALEVLVADWEQTLRLQREAKAMRAGVEASVLLLAFLPFVFLVTLQLLAPALLTPLRSPFGEFLFGLAVAWMVAGYRLLQKMSEPPREERVPLRESIA